MPRWAAESSSFNSQPGTWRTFQISTRLEITNPEGNTQTLAPVAAVKADWFKSLGKKAKKALRNVPLGGTLVMKCTDPLTVIDVPHFYNQAGHTLGAQQRRSEVYIFRIVKQR